MATSITSHTAAQQTTGNEWLRHNQVSNLISPSTPFHSLSVSLCPFFMSLTPFSISPLSSLHSFSLCGRVIVKVNRAGFKEFAGRQSNKYPFNYVTVWHLSLSTTSVNKHLGQKCFCMPQLWILQFKDISKWSVDLFTNGWDKTFRKAKISGLKFTLLLQHLKAGI